MPIAFPCVPIGCDRVCVMGATRASDELLLDWFLYHMANVYRLVEYWHHRITGRQCRRCGPVVDR